MLAVELRGVPIVRQQTGRVEPDIALSRQHCGGTHGWVGTQTHRFPAVLSAFETIEPVGARVLVLKDEPKRETKGGIALPDASEIPTITGRIVSISRQVEHDQDMPLRQYDKIIFHPKNAIPVDFEPDNQLYVVPVEDVVAVFRKQSGPSKKAGELE